MKKKGKMAACLILLVLLLAVLVVLTAPPMRTAAVRILVQTPKKWLIFQKMM